MKKNMKKITTLLFISMFSLLTNAQNGIVSISNIDDNLPIGQWFIIKDNKLDNNAFFYDKTSVVVDELIRMLSASGKTFINPDGSNDEYDPYWVIVRNSGFVTYVYLTRGKDGDEYSSLKTVTE
jgi:hypothetical protein